MPHPSWDPTKKAVIRPGDGNRSRWEINGFSSDATPLINFANFQDALKREATQQYKWYGLIPPTPDTVYEPEPEKKKKSRKHSRRSKTSMDTSWNEAKIDMLCRKSERVKERFQNLRKDRPKQEFKPLNDKQAFRTPMPGYTGFLPRIRRDLNFGGSKAEMYSASTKSWVAPRTDVIVKEEVHGRPGGPMADYRAQCLLNIGKSSPFVIELGAPPIPRPLVMNMTKDEYGF